MRRSIWMLALLVISLPLSAAGDEASFTYHGYLDVDGVPITGAYDFRVQVRGDALDCASTLPDLASRDLPNVQVTAGRFVLEVGPLNDTVNALDAIYVRIALKAHEASEWHSLTGCARILPALRAVRSAPGMNFRVTGALVPDDGTLQVQGAVTSTGAVTATVAKVGNTYPGGTHATFQHKDAPIYALMQAADGSRTYVHANTEIELRAGADQTNDLTIGHGLATMTGAIRATGSITANQAVAGWGIPPIGTIMAWHKAAAGATPLTLPAGWVECNGQLIADPQSPLDGKNAPDLNNQKKFLRGQPEGGVSGQVALAGIGKHQHVSGAAAGGLGGYYAAYKLRTSAAVAETSVTLMSSTTWNTAGSTDSDDDTVSFANATGYTNYSAYRPADETAEASWPTYFTVTWIMRVK